MSLWDAILFDLDGTLLDDEYATSRGLHAFETAFGFTGLREEWQRLLRLHFPDYLNGSISLQEQRRRRVTDLFRSAGRDIAGEAADAAFLVYLQAYKASWRAFADVIPALGQLRGRRLAVLTNGQEEQQMSKLQAIGLNGYFDAVFTPERIGYAKPAAAAFLAACGKLGAKPDRCMYVGDDIDVDARASFAAGLDGVWLNRRGAPDDFNGRIIRTLTELTLLL